MSRGNKVGRTFMRSIEYKNLRIKEAHPMEMKRSRTGYQMLDINVAQVLFAIAYHFETFHARYYKIMPMDLYQCTSQ